MPHRVDLATSSWQLCQVLHTTVMQKHRNTVSNTDNSLISETGKNGSVVNTDHFGCVIHIKTSPTCV